jgi:general secretion pathway protein C
MTRLDRACAVLAVCASVASLVWAALPVARHSAGIVVLDSLPLPDAPKEQNDAADLSALLTFTPFGHQPQSQPAQSSAKRPEIILRGIFASQTSASTALLEVDGETGLYRAEMVVADALVVTQILPDVVHLKDDQSTVSLRFDETTEGKGTTRVTDTRSDLMARLRQSTAVPAKYQPPKAPETTADYIDYWRHRIRKNPQAVLDEIGLRPTDAGYVIAETHDIGVRLAGLQSGDLVRMVNGQNVGDPDSDRALYDQIAAAGIARLEVERDGKTLSFSFPLR